MLKYTRIYAINSICENNIILISLFCKLMYGYSLQYYSRNKIKKSLFPYNSLKLQSDAPGFHQYPASLSNSYNQKLIPITNKTSSFGKKKNF